MSEDEMMSSPEVRAFFGGKGAPISQTSLWRMVKRGQLPQPVKIGAFRRWRRSDCEAAMRGFVEKGKK